MTRILPVAGVLALALAVLLAVSPDFRGEASLSVSRAEAHYVELSFSDASSARECGQRATAQDLDVSIRSHLAEEERVPVEVTVEPRSAESGAASTTRTLAVLTPGQLTQVSAALPPVTRAGYDVTVSLSGRPETLRLHCRGT